jgi:hypothetical protein
MIESARNDFASQHVYVHAADDMEGGMESGCYEIVRDNDKWTICACGMKLIACRDRRTALRTAKQAAALLKPDTLDPDGAESSRHPAADTKA